MRKKTEAKSITPVGGEKEILEILIRLEVSYSEQSEPKKEVRNLFAKAYTFLFDGKLQRAKEAVCAIIEMIRSYYDPP